MVYQGQDYMMSPLVECGISRAGLYDISVGGVWYINNNNNNNKNNNNNNNDNNNNSLFKKKIHMMSLLQTQQT